MVGPIYFPVDKNVQLGIRYRLFHWDLELMIPQNNKILLHTVRSLSLDSPHCNNSQGRTLNTLKHPLSRRYQSSFRLGKGLVLMTQAHSSIQ